MTRTTLAIVAVAAHHREVQSAFVRLRRQSAQAARQSGEKFGLSPASRERLGVTISGRE